MTELQRKLCDEARSWVGIRWRHQGRTRRGIDCGGLIIAVGETVLGRPLGWDDLSGYKRHPTGDSLRAACEAGLDQITRADVRPGDVLLFRQIKEGWPVHLCIVVDGPERLHMVHAHAWNRPPKVVENGLDEWWWDFVTGCFRYREVA